ncbi:hypothetical protein [Nocardia sp.]|uniref:hypothetical protein n=1 Tax=Nocardia sp. TaxID=1821 RepID=UPI0026233DFF|nr:hypothetical protein [Nocardia sp.]
MRHTARTGFRRALRDHVSARRDLVGDRRAAADADGRSRWNSHAVHRVRSGRSSAGGQQVDATQTTGLHTTTGLYTTARVSAYLHTTAGSPTDLHTSPGLHATTRVSTDLHASPEISVATALNATSGGPADLHTTPGLHSAAGLYATPGVPARTRADARLNGRTAIAAEPAPGVHVDA